MLDDDARRALEQEAIALVNLSNSQPLLAKKRSAPLTAAEAVVLAPKPKRLRPPHPQQGVHSLLHQNKATPTARRDDSFVSHLHRGMTTTVGGRGSPDHDTAFEQGPVVLKSLSPTSTTTTTPDAHISMQSLLVTMESHSANVANDMPPPAATKLPRFRDVFDPSSLKDRSPMASNVQLQTSVGVSYAAAPSPSPVPSPSPPPTTHDVSPAVENLPYPPPPELKCKYRTGKCNNQRALKSCGDYHNLCNYHRLRANANQRKLDRKKKVQRVQPGSGDGLMEEGVPSPGATAPTLHATPMTTTTASAVATTLASLPSSSFLMPRSGGPPSRDGRYFLSCLVAPSAPTGMPLPPPPSSSSLSSSSMRPRPC